MAASSLSNISRSSRTGGRKLASIATGSSRSILSGIRPPEIELDQRYSKAFPEQADMLRRHSANMVDWWKKIAVRIDEAVEEAIAGMESRLSAAESSIAELQAGLSVSAQASIGSVVDATPAAEVSDSDLIDWTNGERYQTLSATYSPTGHIESSTVRWPDGTFGTFTTTEFNADHLAVDAYQITHVASGKRVVQKRVTRDDDGNVSIKPALIIL